ncbi:MAG: 3-isopropylmalate dehydrogenase [Acidobacteriota bacterium]
MFKLAVLPGDGIGPEVVDAALEVFDRVVSKFKPVDAVSILRRDAGGVSIDRHGEPLPEETLETCKQCDAVLLGAVGGPRWDHLEAARRPEKALLGLRKGLGLFANLRPVRLYASLIDSSPLKPEIARGVDLLIVRELTGGIYFGQPRGRQRDERGAFGVNTEIYYDFEVERIARAAFEAARQRRRKVTSVDKANVLESSQLWREVVMSVGAEYDDVALDHLYVDNCSMQLVTRPGSFDVIVTTNMFGDILSDEAAVLAGSIGMLPSASLGSGRALYEPVHGSAPDIAGTGAANPLAAIACVAMLVEHSLQRRDIALRIEQAIEGALESGARTRDLGPGARTVSTGEMTKCVLERL